MLFALVIQSTSIRVLPPLVHSSRRFRDIHRSLIVALMPPSSLIFVFLHLCSVEQNSGAESIKHFRGVSDLSTSCFLSRRDIDIWIRLCIHLVTAWDNLLAF